jgi:predicted RNase H-like HicB family nuclease
MKYLINTKNGKFWRNNLLNATLCFYHNYWYGTTLWNKNTNERLLHFSGKHTIGYSFGYLQGKLIDECRKNLLPIPDLLILRKIISKLAKKVKLTVGIKKEKNGFSIFALNLPGCASMGDTKRLAIKNIKEAFLGLAESYLNDSDFNYEIPFGLLIDIKYDKIIEVEVNISRVLPWNILKHS